MTERKIATKPAVASLRMIGQRSRLLSVCLLAGALGACSWQGSMRPTVNLSLDAPQPYTVQAWGYPAADGDPQHALYYSLSIRLRAARPFNFTFPDGAVFSSTQITAEVLSTHLAPVSQASTGRLVSQVSYAGEGRNYSILFALGPDGYAESLRLYACKHVMRKLIGASDGTRTFDFPLRQQEIADVFGGPLRIGHDFVILGYECD